MENEFRAGWCPFCNQGSVVFIKPSSSDEILLLCEECDTLWSSPREYRNDTPLGIYDFEVYGLGLPVTKEEIVAKGWERFIIDADQDEMPFFKLH